MMTFDVAPELSRGRAPSRNAQKGFSYILNVDVLLQRSHEIARAARIPTGAVSSNARLERTLPHRESHGWVERMTDVGRHGDRLDAQLSGACPGG